MNRSIEYVRVADLVPADVNPKRHDKQALAASVDRFGFIEPIVRDDRTGRLVAGHGRMNLLVEAAAAGEAPPEGVVVDEAGDWTVPVVGWTSADDAEASAYLIAANRITERGGWDNTELATLLDSLTSLDGVGFDGPDLDDLLASIQESPDVAFDENNRMAPAGKESTYDEWGENYRNKQVRSMVFDYPLDDYAVVAGSATRARRSLGIDSNAELFQHLLAEWVAANPEAVEAEPATA